MALSENDALSGGHVENDALSGGHVLSLGHGFYCSGQRFAPPLKF